MSGFTLIRQARQIIANETGWTQEECARNEIGEPVRTNSKDARSFDIVGALQRVADLNTKEGCDDYFAATKMLKRWLPKGSDLFSFNDSHGHADVLDLLDRAAGAEEITETVQPVPASVSSILRRVAPQRRSTASGKRSVA